MDVKPIHFRGTSDIMQSPVPAPLPADATLEQRAIAAIRNWLPLRTAMSASHEKALFVGRSGTRLTIYSIENIFKKHVRLAEIKRHVTPHSLRHTMAAMLVSSGTDIREVQEYLGHERIESTEVYTRIFPDDLKELVNRTHPRETRFCRETVQ